MTTPAQDAPLVFPEVAFRPLRLFAVAVVLTAVAVAGGYVVTHSVKFGAFFFGIGMVLGLANALLVRRAVAKVTAKDHPLKMQMAANSAMRLAIVSAIALVIAWFFKPTGVGVLFGVALFQAILVMATALPVMKKLRAGNSEGDAGAHDGSVVKD